MNKSKKDVSLTEKDALQDMLDVEKLLMTYYGDALIEGSSQPFRNAILKSYTKHAETQFRIFEQMLARGYYEVQPAAKMLIDQQTENFSKIKKQIAAE